VDIGSISWLKKTVVVELKTIESLQPIHEAQPLTYLKVGGWPVGLLINFNLPVLNKGIKRMVNNLRWPLRTRPLCGEVLYFSSRSRGGRGERISSKQSELSAL
jgi:hypothetical protein